MNDLEVKQVRRKIINEVIGIEGGYVNDRKDSGGATKFGITKATGKKHGFNDVRLLTHEDAYRIYESDYWDDLSGDDVLRRSEKIIHELFDTAVNMGESRSGHFLQRALNVYNLNGTLYPDLTIDSNIGQQTLTALDAFLKKRGRAGERVLYNTLNGLQTAFYVTLSEERPKDEKYTYGWVSNRVNSFSQESAGVPERTDSLTTENRMQQQEVSAMTQQQINPMNSRWARPADGWVSNNQGQKVPYLQSQLEAFNSDHAAQENAFALLLEAQMKASGKPAHTSKLWLMGAGFFASGVTGLLAKFGLDADPDLIANILLALVVFGGPAIMIIRKWYTNTFVK